VKYIIRTKLAHSIEEAIMKNEWLK